MGCWEAHVGQHVSLGLVHEAGEPGQGWTELIGYLAPLAPGGLGVVLGEGGSDEGRDHAAAAPAGVGQGAAKEVDPAALPGGAQDLGGRSLDPLMGIGDHQLDPAQAAPGQLAQKP
jgi:hypothetical protein